MNPLLNAPPALPVVVDFRVVSDFPTGKAVVLRSSHPLPDLAPLLRDAGFRADFFLIDAEEDQLTLAMDCLSVRGEVLLSGPSSGVWALLLDREAPCGSFRCHAWASLEFDGRMWVWLSGQHQLGIRREAAALTDEEVDEACRDFRRERFNLIQVNTESCACHTTESIWNDVMAEWKHQQVGAVHPDHFSLKDGKIQFRETAFERKRNVNDPVAREWSEAAQALHQRTPESLLVEKLHRGWMKRHLLGDHWRVHPDLRERVIELLRGLPVSRAPLRKLEGSQRFSYVDEIENLMCKRDLDMPGVLRLRAGTRYPVHVEPVTLSKMTRKPNMKGDMELYRLSGQESMVVIEEDFGVEFGLLDARHLQMLGDGENQVRLSVVLPLQKLEEHFEFDPPAPLSEVLKKEFAEMTQRLINLQEAMNSVTTSHS